MMTHQYSAFKADKSIAQKNIKPYLDYFVRTVCWSALALKIVLFNDERSGVRGLPVCVFSMIRQAIDKRLCA